MSTVHHRIAAHFAALNEAGATEFSRAVAAYARERGDGLFGTGARTEELRGYLKSRITGGYLFLDKSLAALLPLMNDMETATFRADPQIRARIDEYDQFQIQRLENNQCEQRQKTI